MPDKEERMCAHRYIIFNCDEVRPYIDRWKRTRQTLHMVKNNRSRTDLELENEAKKHFPRWFQLEAAKLAPELAALAMGPKEYCLVGNAYVVNGFRFHTRELEQRRKTQNNGVHNRGYVGDVLSDYVGVLVDVCRFNYAGGKLVVLFKCDWYDSVSQSRGAMHIDQYGFMHVNAMKLSCRDDPYVLLTQVSQIYYIDNVYKKDWRTIVFRKLPHVFVSCEDSEDEDAAGFL
jgi:hypothetical protein